jgi:hypothetical protein
MSSRCLDCGGSDCVCRILRELADAKEAIAVYERFFEVVGSATDDADAESPRVNALSVDDEHVKLSDRAAERWMAVCLMIDKQNGFPTPA